MSQTLRAWLGFLFAPAIPCVLLYWGGLVLEFGSESILVLILLPFAYAAAVILGIPAYWLLRRKQCNSLWAYLLSGAGIGVLTDTLLFGTWAGLSYSAMPDHALGMLENIPRSAVTATVYAASSSLCFWLIAVKTYKIFDDEDDT